MRIKLLTTLSIICMITCITYAQELDPDFGLAQSGKMITYFSSSEDLAVKFAQDHVVGSTMVNGNRDFAMSSLKIGAFDNTEGRKTVDFNGGQDYATAIGVQGLTKYVVGYTTNNGVTSFALSKFYKWSNEWDFSNEFGTLGKKVMSVGGVDDRLYATVITTNGKLLIGGYTTNGTNKDFVLCLLKSDGQLDTSFGTNGKVITDMGGQDVIKAIEITSEGKIVVAGTSTIAGNSDFAMARYTWNGILDTTFNATGKVVTAVGSGNDFVHSIVTDVNKIILVGSSYNGSDLDFAMVRYTDTGQVDTNFASNGILLQSFGPGDDEATAALKISNYIIVTGYTYNGFNKDVVIAKYGGSNNAVYDGQLIPSFGDQGKVITDMGPGDDVPYGMLQTEDNYYRIGGASFNGQNNDVLYAEYTNEGILSEAFGHHGIARVDFGVLERAEAHGMVKQVDNKIVVAGAVGEEGKDFNLVRYRFDGSLDPDFGVYGRVTTSVTNGDDVIYAVGIQPDQKIVACGATGNAYGVVRYHINGTIDSSFGTAGVVTLQDWYQMSAIEVQPDGKILIFGEKSAGNVHSGKLMRLNSNGTPDTAFGTLGTGIALIPNIYTTFGDASHSILIQPDGKIVVGGGSGLMGCFLVARLNTNGTPDTTFGSGTGRVTTPFSGSANLNSFTLQPDGKIIAAGSAGSNATSNLRFIVTRYTTGGVLDTSFSEDGIYSRNVFSSASAGNVVIQPDGRLVFVGKDGANWMIFRVDADGAYDSGFSYIQDKFNGTTSSSVEMVGATLINNKLLIGGYAYYIGINKESYGLAKYALGLPLYAEDFTKDDNVVKVIAYPNPVTNKVTIKFNFDTIQAVSVELYDISGKKIAVLLNEVPSGGGNEQAVNLPDLAKGAYILRVISSHGSASIKIIK